MTEKLDLKKKYKEFYSPPSKQPVIVDIPPLLYAMLDGEIEAGNSPGTSPAFQAATEALYGISYTLKFISKEHPVRPLDYTVMGLEALWWVEGEDFDIRNPSNWKWTAMILQPEHITPERFAEGVAQLLKKRGGSPAISALRLETYHEGPSVQILHIGPYADEPASLERMAAFASSQGYQFKGKHHEIYLSDPRRTAPEKLKTILRHPVS